MNFEKYLHTFIPHFQERNNYNYVILHSYSVKNLLKNIPADMT